MARVIRGDGRVTKRAVVDAEAKARAMLATATLEARALVDAAEAAAASIEERARDAGREQGLATAAAQLLQAGQAHGAALEEAQKQVAKLATAVARQLLHAELELAPERIRAIVASVLEKNRRAKRVSVRVSAASLEALGDLGPGVDVIGDPELGPGDCVVESDLGRFDARIELRLAALDEALRAAPR